jgi:hypothetical protein
VLQVSIAKLLGTKIQLVHGETPKVVHRQLYYHQGQESSSY